MTRLESLYKRIRDGEIDIAGVDYEKEMALLGMETVIAGQKFAEEMIAEQNAADKQIKVQSPPQTDTSQITVKTEFLDQVNALVEKLENDQSPAAGE